MERWTSYLSISVVASPLTNLLVTANRMNTPGLLHQVQLSKIVSHLSSTPLLQEPFFLSISSYPHHPSLKSTLPLSWQLTTSSSAAASIPPKPHLSPQTLIPPHQLLILPRRPHLILPTHLSILRSLTIFLIFPCCYRRRHAAFLAC